MNYESSARGGKLMSVAQSIVENSAIWHFPVASQSCSPQSDKFCRLTSIAELL